MQRTRLALGLLLGCVAGCGPSAGGNDAGAPVDGGAIDAAPFDAAIDASIDDTGTPIDGGSTRDAVAIDHRTRLLLTYLAFLGTTPDVAQSNGLRAADLGGSICTLWDALDPSSQATFLTLTARLEGSVLGMDGSSAIAHVTRLYRVAGGEGATATDAGSCGGGEFNRLIVSVDPMLHDALVAAHDHTGARQSFGFDVADIPTDGSWRDSHDLAGPHAPFDQSDETNDGAPRGQVQYFADPASTVANAPLGRTDLATLVDPYALEIDQDYDCVHASNPLCSYVTYGPACFPMASHTGVEIYAMTYGAIDLGWRPSGCP